MNNQQNEAPQLLNTEEIKANLPQLLDVTARNNVVLSEKGILIHPQKQLWNKINDQKVTYPVAYDSNDSKEPQLLINLSEINVELLGTSLKAFSNDDTNGKSILFSGIIMNTNEPITLNTTTIPHGFSYLPNNILYYEIELENGEVIPLGSSPIEIYRVNLKHFPTMLSKKGIPVEALRQLANTSSKIDTSSSAQLANLVNSVFSYTPPRYNVINGAPSFITVNGSWNNITLHYNAYLNANYQPNSMLNCYDTASMLQYLILMDNQKALYSFMEPFGYLTATPLIGRGQCNNPFYGGSGGYPVVNQMDPTRTAFGNHAFVYINGLNTVADACAGPHTGGETAQQYVTSAVDTIYPQPPRVRQGTVNDITNYAGVQSINSINSITNLSNMTFTNEFKKIMNFSDNFNGSSNQFVAGKWPEILDNSQLDNSWKKTYEEIVPGEKEILKMAFYKKEDKMLTIKMYIGSSNNNELASNRFLSIGSLSQMPEIPYKKGPDSLGSYAAVNKDNSQEYSRCFWTFHNIVIDISSNDTTVDVVAISQWYFEWAQENLINDFTGHLPSVNINSSGLNTKSGEEFHISLIDAENVMIDYIHNEDTPRLITSDDKNLVFDNLQSNHKELVILAIDKQTLLVNKKTIKLND